MSASGRPSCWTLDSQQQLVASHAAVRSFPKAMAVLAANWCWSPTEPVRQHLLAAVPGRQGDSDLGRCCGLYKQPS